MALFGLMFNRLNSLSSLVLIFIAGYFTTAEVHNVEFKHLMNTNRLVFAQCLAMSYIMAGLCMTITFTALKHLFKRQRPPVDVYGKRCVDARSKEENTFSMPSGDACCCALWCFMIAAVL